MPQLSPSTQGSQSSYASQERLDLGRTAFSSHSEKPSLTTLVDRYNRQIHDTPRSIYLPDVAPKDGPTSSFVQSGAYQNHESGVNEESVDKLISNFSKQDSRLDHNSLLDLSNRLMEHLKEKLTHYDAALRCAQSTNDVSAIQGKAIRSIGGFLDEVKKSCATFHINGDLLVKNIESDRALIEALAKILFVEPIDDTRTPMESSPQKRSGVHTLTIPRDRFGTETATYYIVNQSVDRDKMLGSGSFSTVKVAIAGDENGMPGLHNREKELAIKKIKPFNLNEVIAAYKEAQIMTELSYINGICKIESSFIYRSYKYQTEKNPGTDEIEQLPFNIAIIMERESPIAEINHALFATRPDKLAVLLNERLDHYRDLTATLSQIQELGFVHNDVNHKNVMRNRDGKIKLIDFGLSLRTDSTLYENGIKPYQVGGGTPSPELGKSRTDSNLDLGKLANLGDIDTWAIGQMMLRDFFPQIRSEKEYRSEMSNDSFFHQDNSKQLTELAVKAIESLRSAPLDKHLLSALVAACLSPTPAERPSIQELNMLLENCSTRTCHGDLCSEFEVGH